MTWELAMAFALQESRARRRKMYVRGYRKEWTGEWRYGIYLDPRPPIMGRSWK